VLSSVLLAPEMVRRWYCVLGAVLGLRAVMVCSAVPL